MRKSRKKIDLTFRMQPQAVESVATCGLVRDLSISDEERQHLISTYFDTPHHALRRSAAALCIRENGLAREQTLTARVEGPAGPRKFAEWTVPIDSMSPDLRLIGNPSIRKRFTARGYEKRLRPIFTAEVERRTWRLKTRGAEVELAIDQGAIRGRRRNGKAVSEPISEADLELISGDPARMLEIAIRLNELAGLQRGHRTKSQRGYSLIQPSLRPAPFKAEKVLLDADMTAGEAFRAIVTSTLQHLFENEEPALRGDPEGIHQVRVTIRRLRVAMRAFKRILPYDGRKAFKGEFRWLQQWMSPPRDWHVFLHETLPLVATGREDSPEIGHLRRIAREQRLRASREAAKRLASKRYTRLILHFEHWLAGLPDARDGGGFDQPLALFAEKALGKAYRNLMPEHRTLSRLSGAELHAMRIAGKKARYTAEFFRSLYPYPETQRYLELLTWIQDRLGEVNDATTARQVLTTVNARRIPLESERRVREWSEKRVVQCARAAQSPWRRFVNMTPFWELHEPAE